MPWPTLLARVALVLDVDHVHHGGLTLNGLLSRMSLGQDAGELPDHDARLDLLHPDEVEVEETAEVLAEDLVIDIVRGPGDFQDTRLGTIKVLAVLVPIPTDTDAATADDDSMSRMSLLEEALGTETGAEGDLGRGGEVLLTGWVDVHGVHFAAVADASKHLEVGQVGGSTFDPDACVHVIRQTGHLVGGGAHAAQVVAVGVAGGVPMGMVEESGWPEGLHALGLNLPHLADDADGISTLAWPKCEGVHLGGIHWRGPHLKGTRLKGIHLKWVHWKGVHLKGVHLKGVHLKGVHLSKVHLEEVHLKQLHLIGVHLKGS